MLPCKIIIYPAGNSLDTTDEVSGKFLQCRWRGVEYLLFATREAHRFHNQILGQFLGEQGLPHQWLDEQTLQIQSDELSVIGGGRFRFTGTENRLQLWDNSQAYGRFDADGLAQRIRHSSHHLASAAIEID